MIFLKLKGKDGIEYVINTSNIRCYFKKDNFTRLVLSDVDWIDVINEKQQIDNVLFEFETVVRVSEA